ncbi:MAG: bifunctional riboflavin kinase/FAD synthetase [Firmicutes bacterium]|nr:bifunctional riboflavin kinase/FAD synthetase [Bacillota bacterium]
MERIRWTDPCPYGNKPVVFAIGFFDGIHLGHRRLIREARRLADAQGADVAVLSFDPHPSVLLNPQDPVPMIYTPEEREWILFETGMVDHFVLMRFEESLARMEPEDFVGKVLFTGWNCKGVVVGEDFRFGNCNSGSAVQLAELCRTHGAAAWLIPDVTEDGCKVSASLIRELLIAGNIEEANRLLGRPYLLMGTVGHGRGLGHRRLIPTVNLPYIQGKIVPKKGVYATRTFWDGEAHDGVSNIGVNPTVSEGTDAHCESFLFDLNEDLYGVQMRTELYHFIRPERKFADVEALRTQQRSDVLKARKYLQSSG